MGWWFSIDLQNQNNSDINVLPKLSLKLTRMSVVRLGYNYAEIIMYNI